MSNPPTPSLPAATYDPSTQVGGQCGIVHNLFYLFAWPTQHLRRELQRVLKMAGLTPAQWDVLVILSKAHRPMTAVELMTNCPYRPLVTDVTNLLFSNGWIRCDLDPSDYRRRFCTITPDGREILRQLDAPLTRLFEAQTKQLTSEERSTLVSLLLRVEPFQGGV